MGEKKLSKDLTSLPMQIMKANYNTSWIAAISQLTGS
jgi:hypothetical protein